MDKPNSKMSRKKTNNVIPFQVDAAFFFERAVHYLDRHDLKNAVKNFRKAVEYEPDNPVNHCNLAGVLSELGDFDESNNILKKILQDIDPDMVECYFYMANNYANLGQYDLAEEYVARYLELDPKGEFSADAGEMMDILVQEFGGGKVMTEMKQRQETEQRGRDLARQLLEEGKFMEATEYLEQAIADQPDSTAPRNNLSLAYYYLGELDKAIEIAQAVLERDASNVHALCNLAVFYQHLGDKEHLNEILHGLRKLYPLYFDHSYKLATTMGILGEHTTAYRLFRQLLRWSDRTDAALLHCVAAAAANLGFYDRAKRIWQEVAALDPESDIPAFFLNKMKEALDKGLPMQNVSYQYHIPFQEQFKMMKEQLQTGKLGGWRNDPLIRSSLFWALRHGDVETKTQVIQTFALIADKEVEHALREFLKDPDELEQLKSMARVVLRDMGVAFSADTPGDASLPAANLPLDELLAQEPLWAEVLTHAETELQGTMGDDACVLARQIWGSYLNRVYHAPPKIAKTASWSAALEYAVLRQMGIRISQADVARRYDVSAGTVSKLFRALTEKAENREE